MQKKKSNKNKNKKNRMFLKICLLAIFFVNSNSNRKFIKNTKKSIMFLRTSFVELLISCYYVNRCNTEVKN